MPERKGHYLAKPTRPTVPGVIFSVALHIVRTGSSSMPHVTVNSWGSAYVGVIYRKRTGWTHPAIAWVGTGEALREWMFDHALDGRQNWVICQSCHDVLTLSQWWQYASVRPCVWRQTRGNPEGTRTDHSRGDRIVFDRFSVQGDRYEIRYTHSGKLWRWCNRSNWWGTDTGAGNGGVDDSTVGGSWAWKGSMAADDRGLSEVARCLQESRRLCDWWKEKANAGFGATVGQLAMGLLRTHCPPRTLCTHSDDEAHSLERAASFGGRASVWYVGAIGDGCGLRGLTFGHHEGQATPVLPGPITQVDVRSMYVSIMRTEAVPTKLIGVRADVSPKECLQLCERFGVIARVRVRTSQAEYPVRRGEGVIYPTGEFVTTLTGIELLELVKHGEVLECQAVASYHRSPVLSAFATWLLSELTRADTARSALPRNFLKRIGNSLPGKLAQRLGKWERHRAGDERGRWGDGAEVVANSQTTVRLKYLNGFCWRFCPDASGAGPHTAAFAYIAARGRLTMAHLRRGLPERAVVSQDTDGLWILGTNTAVSAMLGGAVGPEPGQLRIAASADNARFLGPRHYCVDGSWVLSGYHAPTVEAGGATVWDIVHPGLWATRLHGPPTTTATITRKASLPLDVASGRVQADGWVLPPHLIPRKPLGAS